MENAHARPTARPLHLGWATRAVVSGFLGSLAALPVLAAAYGFAAAVGTTDPRANIFSAWLYYLAYNRVTSVVQSIHVVQAVGLHVVAGVIWAAVYAAYFECRLAGPGWRKGLIFAVIPCVISLVVILPIMGAGFFGLGLGAGPLAGFGVVMLHAVYGAVMGEAYALADGEGALGGPDSAQARAFATVERDMAGGLVIGAIAGAIVGLILAAFGFGSPGPDGLVLTAAGAATEGAFIGFVVGIFVGWVTS